MTAMTHAAPAAVPGQKDSRLAERIHTINVNDLILHQYEEKDVIARKAFKIANDVIVGELRQGEFMRQPRPGVFQLIFPAMAPEAGALRSSVIASQIAREITRVNPGKIGLTERAETIMARRAAEPRRVAANLPPLPAKADGGDAAGDAEMRRQASMAVEMMSANTMRLEELLGREPQDAAAALKVCFQPVWQARKKVISAYYCRIVGTEDADHAGADAAEGADGAGDALAVMSPSQKDAALLLKVGQVLEQARDEGMPGLMIVPVHFSTLDNVKVAAAYLEALSMLAEQDRETIVFNVVDIPGDASRFRLREAVASLKNRCRCVFAGVDAGCTEMTRFADAGFLGVGTFTHPKRGEKRLLRQMDDFVRAAEKARLLTFVTGLQSKSLLLGSFGSGFDYMAGPVLARPVGRPAGILRMELDLVYVAAAQA